MARRSRQAIGEEIVAYVAEKLRDDEGKSGLWNRHRDYCGHGLIFRDNRYQLLQVEDGNPDGSPVLSEWESNDDFVSWLARQSDYSLSGADDSEPLLFTDNPAFLDNQRLSKERLRDYAHDCPGSMTAFREYLYAADLEFRFMVETYGFRKLRPRMESRELIVSYRRLPYAGISFVSEYVGPPIITATLRENEDAAYVFNGMLFKIASDRNPGWDRPEFPSSERTEAAYRSYFRDIADLLRSDFQDLLELKG